jgi:hypothetical protein
VTREDLQNFSSELFILLKGPPVSLLDYFTENKTQRMGRRLYRVIQEEFLVKGLKNIILQFPEREQYTMIENAKIFIGRVTRNKLWQLTSLPLDLPFINRLDLPSELLEKILLDGIEPHSTALLAHFKKQNMLDNYERFRTAYRTVAFGAFFIYFYHESKHKLYEQRKEAEEENKKKFLEAFKKLSDIIQAEVGATIKTEKELQDEQFNRILKEFKEKYKEDPTPEEYEELKRKVYN